MPRLSFREKVLRVREDAIVDAANRLLANKGFDLMTVDDVAAEVGIAKASLYKHFASKEALAAAAMVRLLQRTLAFVDAQDGDASPQDEAATLRTTGAGQRLQALVRWALAQQLAGEMPSLPAQNSSLRAELLASKPYLELLLQLSERLGAWIVQAQADGDIDRELPPEVVLYTIYARGCDPVPAFLKASGQFGDEQIVEWVLSTCWRGLRGQ